MTKGRERTHMKNLRVLAAIAAIVAVATTVVTRGAQVTPSASDQVRISGWALNMSNIATGANQSIQITIDKWSSPEQRQQLIEAFEQKKQAGLVTALGKQPEQAQPTHAGRPVVVPSRRHGRG